MAEELPPVVAALQGDDSGFLEMLARDLQAAASFAADLEAVLSEGFGGFTITGADVSSEGVAAAGAAVGEQIAEGVAEGISGLNLGPELKDALGDQAETGIQAGAQIAEGITEGLGDAAAGAAGAGEAAGEAFAEGMAHGTAQVDAAASQSVAQLGEIGRQGGEAFAEGIIAGQGAALGSLAAGAAGAAGIGGRLGAALSAGIIGAATEAGGAGGDAMIGAISDAASQGAPRAAAATGRAIEGALDGAMVQAGGPAGDALLAGIGQGATDGADRVAQQIAEAVQASLESSMAEAGAAAGDALAAGMSSDESAAAQAGRASVIEFEQGAAGVAEEAGAEVGAAWGRGFGNAALVGVDLLEQGLSTAGLIMDPAARAKAAVAAEAAAVAEEIAAAEATDLEFLQAGIDEFTSLAGLGLSEWLEQVQIASESARDAFISVYEQVQAQLEATTALTDEQQGALDLMYFRAREEMDALQAEAIAFNASIKALDFTPSAMTLSTPVGGFTEEQIAATVVAAKAEKAALQDVDAAATGAAGSMHGFGGGMGMAVMAGMGLLGFLPQIKSGLESIGGVGDHTAIGVGNMEASLVGLNSTIPPVGQNLASLGYGLSALSNIRGGGAGVQGIQDLDNALAQLYQTDPQLASEDVATLTKAMEASGTSQSQIAQYLTAYNAAVQQTSISLAAQQHAIEDTVPGTQAYGIAVEQNTIKLQQNVLSTQESNDALAAYGEKLLAAQSAQDYVNSAVAAAGVTMQLQAQATDVANQATVDYTMDVVGARAQVEAMDNALQASYMSMVGQAQSSAQASVGLLQLGNAQQQLNYQLIDAEQGYTEASNGANAYQGALTALSGTTNTLLGSEAAFTTSLGQLTSAVKTNGDSLDVNTTAGAANITAITGIATAADKAAAAVYQNEVQTDGASKAYADANTKLEAEKDAFEAAAEKAGLNKQAVQQLADELFKLPPTLNIGVNTDEAVKEVNGLLEFIDSSTGTVKVFENSAGYVWSSGGGSKAHAAGGVARAGELALFGEEGPELGVPTQDMNIIPAGQTAQILGGGGSSLSLSGGVGGGDMYVFNFYPGVMLGDEYAFTDAIQQAMGRLGLRVPNQYGSVATTRGR